MAPDWVPDAIFYQIFPDRFCNGDPSNDPPGTEPWGNLPNRDNFFGGDLAGILEKLDYLQDLGVNALYLNPIFRARTNHKYDTCDYFEVDPAFGNNDLLKELVRELHHRDMRIILDGVFNHCGDGFWAFEDVKTRGAASPYADWFIVRSYPIRASPLSYYTCGGASYLPKLNLNHRPAREYVLKVAKYWLEEAGIDGWRLDSPCRIPLAFWRKFRAAVKAVNPQAYLVGEIWRDAGPWVRGDVFDGITNYRLRELILDYCVAGMLDAEDFAFEVDMLHQALGNAAPVMLNLLGSHDTPRILTVVRGDVDRLLVAVAFLMTTVGVPLIYYGDEIGLCGDMDPDCRRTMIWDEARWDRRIYDAYRKLINLRRAHPALRRGRFETLLAFDGVYAYRRVYEGDEVVVILNPKSAVVNLAIPTGSDTGVWYDLWAHQKRTTTNGVLLFNRVPAVSFTILVPSALEV
ncbi:MAG: glycoside hydrolase family 13 protein [Chloroflexi bacterium]|nr:glycoside hydrolase family 13 protein [Chloroflexota bacterium]